MSSAVSGCCSRDDFAINFQRIIKFIDTFIYLFESFQKNNLVATLVKLAEELVELIEHKFIIVGFDQFSEIFFIELSFEELEVCDDVIVEGESSFVEVIFELEQDAARFAA